MNNETDTPRTVSIHKGTLYSLPRPPPAGIEPLADIQPSDRVNESSCRAGSAKNVKVGYRTAREECNDCNFIITEIHVL